MRALRVVGITEDGGVVLEDSGRHERFTVPADEQLRAAARGDLTRLGQIAIELESQLRPREIQARIRAGASVEQVAAAAGVPLQKIERFAYPVLLERSRTAEMAQGAHPVRADGPDVRTLGEVVAHTFGLRGQEYLDAEWDSWKGEDSRWVVALSWRAGRSDNQAHWTFQPGAHGGTVTALDEHASDLVEGLPLRPLRTVGPVIELGGRPEDDAPAPEPAEQRAVRAAVGGGLRERAPEHQRTSRPAAPEQRRPPAPRTEIVERTPSVPAQPVASPADPADTRPAAAATSVAATSVAETVAVETAPVESQVESSAPAEPVASEPEPVAEASVETAVEPEAVADAAAEPAAPAAEVSTDAADAAPAPATPAAPAKRGKRGKPVMPSWDEVLLGVRGQQR